MMKKTIMAIAALAATMAALPARAATWRDPSTGITWTYTVSSGKASLGGGSYSSPAVPTTTTGALVIPSSINGYSVTSIGNYAFQNCSGLTSVTIGNGVTSIGDWAFRGCSGLTSVTIPDSVTSIGDYAFFGCIGLTSVTIPDSVTSIGEAAFYSCSGLTSVMIPDSVTSIGDYAFCYCSGLTSVTIPDSVTSIGDYAFRGCSGLTAFAVGSGNPSYKAVSGLLLTKDGKTLVAGVNGNVTIPDSVTSIGNHAFHNRSGLTSVTIPDSVTSIGYAAFSGCSGLTSVTIPDSVTSIGRDAFFCCSGLTSVTIPDSVTSIGSQAFANCSGPTSVTIPDGVTSIGDLVFCNCSGLTSVTIPDSVTSIGYAAFAWCSSLTSVTIPDSVTNIGDRAFSSCSGLVSFTVGDGNVNYKSVNGLLLSKDGKTLIVGVNGDVTIPGSVTSIGDRAFSSCSGLTSVTIPDSVTSIGWEAFYGCSGLTSVTIPDGVTNIGDRAFSSCSGLTSVTMGYGVVVGRLAFESVSGITLMLADGTTAFDTGFLASANELKPKVSILEVPASVTNVQLAAVNQLVNLTKIIFKVASRSAISESDLQYLISSGLEVVYEDDGSGSGGGTEPETPKLPTERMVRIVSSGIRADNPNIFDVTYVVSNMTETANVRILAFKDGVRSFANVLRPATFVDGTEVNVGSNVLANVDHTVSWNVADDWNIDLGRVTAEVLTLENCAIPLKLMTIPRTSSHAAVRFSYNALTSAKVLDALFWHYASPESGLTLTDGVLTSGDVVLANGTDVTAEGVRYVLEAHGYRLLEGEELEYVKRLSRLSLEPSGARQYGIVTLQD